MHTILETDCFVLKSSPAGEANKHLDIFTKDFGLIRASAQGLRYIKSKLRYSLTDFSYSRVSLVRGREFWRIITATKKGDVPSEVVAREARESLYRIFSLLRRLLQGEEAHPELFDIVLNAFNFFSQDFKDEDGASPARISAIEELAVLRILFLLGYVKDDPDLVKFLETDDLSRDLIERAIESRKTIVLEINRALKASHL